MTVHRSDFVLHTEPLGRASVADDLATDDDARVGLHALPVLEHHRPCGDAAHLHYGMGPEDGAL